MVVKLGSSVLVSTSEVAGAEEAMGTLDMVRLHGRCSRLTLDDVCAEGGKNERCGAARACLIDRG